MSKHDPHKDLGYLGLGISGNREYCLDHGESNGRTMQHENRKP